MDASSTARPALAVSDAMRGLLGKPYRETVSESIALTEVVRWERAVYWPDPPPVREAGDEVPLEFNPFAWLLDDLDEPDPAEPDSFIEGRVGQPGPGSSVSVNGELDVTYGEAMRLGDRITAVSRIVDYRIRAGATGPLLLTDVEREWRNQRDELVKLERNTIVRW